MKCKAHHHLLIPSAPLIWSQVMTWFLLMSILASANDDGEYLPTSTFEWSDCAVTKLIDMTHSSNSDVLFLWHPPTSGCQLRLQMSLLDFSRVASFQAVREGFTPPYAVNSCRPGQMCTWDRNCLDVAFTSSTVDPGLTVWNWTNPDPNFKIYFTLAQKLNVLFCGEGNVTVRIRINGTKSDDASSWDVSMFLTHVVIPMVCVFIFATLLIFVLICIVRRSRLCWRQRTPATTSLDAVGGGRRNPAFEEDPPSYKDFYKYPLSERFQEMQAKSLSSQPQSSATPTSSSAPSEATSGYTLPSSGTPQGDSNSRPPTPPPLYEHTKKVEDDVDGNSLYCEVFVVDESTAGTSSAHASTNNYSGE